MTTRQITRITLIACILSVIFRMFSDILYLEMVTFTLVIFALVFDAREVISASMLFAFLNILTMGLTPWTIGYMLIYPSYAFLTVKLKPYLLKHELLLAFYTGTLSFLCGQLMDLPFILFSGKITLVYIIMGLKTSLIQGSVSGITMLFLNQKVYQVLCKIKERMIL